MARLYKYIIGIAGVALAAFLVWYFSNVVAYILISAVFALLGKPLVDWMMRMRIGRLDMNRNLAALVALLLLCSAVVGLMLLFVPVVFGTLNNLSGIDFARLQTSLHAPLASLQEWLNATFGVTESDFSVTDNVAGRITAFVNGDHIGQLLTTLMSTTIDTLVAVGSILFITFFFLREDKLFNNMVVAIFPSRYEQNINHAMRTVTDLLVKYFIGLMIESLLFTLALAVTLICFGLPVKTAFFMGLIVGILNVIPYIGPIIGGVICVLMGAIDPIAGATFGDMVLIIGGSVVGLKILDMFVLQPLLFSGRAAAHPLEIFLVILIAGSVAGVMGILLAIPAYNVIRVFAKEFFNNFRLVQRLTENI
ncbi:MAG: AI-2E family transporter [Rikenellaceae bacterium]|jgi:predicted PurR-regulated permease PerM|nr:AI-2E family transporter [Rikenellaceae bacterium]